MELISFFLIIIFIRLFQILFCENTLLHILLFFEVINLSLITIFIYIIFLFQLLNFLPLLIFFLRYSTLEAFIFFFVISYEHLIK